MQYKLLSKGGEKPRVANYETPDLENPAAKNSEVRRKHDEPSSVEPDALPSTETSQPEDPTIDSQSDHYVRSCLKL